MLDTQSKVSVLLTADEFYGLAAHLDRTYEMDMFLSGPGRPADRLSYLCLIPVRELVVESATTVHDLKEFAYGDDQPTFGYLSYTYGMVQRCVASRHQSAFPYGQLKKYRAIVTFDSSAAKVTVHGNDPVLIKELKGLMGRKPWLDDQPDTPHITVIDQRQSLTRDDYMKGVEDVLALIKQGEVYQLNLSIKFMQQLSEVPGSRLALDMLQQFPAPYYTWFRTGDYRILSTSPERFLHVRNGTVTSEPVKGTLRFSEYSEALAEQLTSSPKEDAELSMIVDLIRNDISKNCDYGSVKVSDHKWVFAVDNLLQMYSRVEGRMKSEATCLDLLVDAFPGGSITGCPKKRAMEHIDKLEPHARDVYCGSFFILWGPDDMDSSIAIRTGYFDRSNMTFSYFAGSGIVVSSEPESEYAETMAKAEKFQTLFSGRGGDTPGLL